MTNNKEEIIEIQLDCSPEKTRRPERISDVRKRVPSPEIEVILPEVPDDETPVIVISDDDDDGCPKKECSQQRNTVKKGALDKDWNSTLSESNDEPESDIFKKIGQKKTSRRRSERTKKSELIVGQSKKESRWSNFDKDWTSTCSESGSKRMLPGPSQRSRERHEKSTRRKNFENSELRLRKRRQLVSPKLVSSSDSDFEEKKPSTFEKKRPRPKFVLSSDSDSENHEKAPAKHQNSAAELTESDRADLSSDSLDDTMNSVDSSCKSEDDSDLFVEGTGEAVPSVGELPEAVKKLLRHAEDNGGIRKDGEDLIEFAQAKKKVFLKNFLLVNSGEEDALLYGRLEDLNSAPSETEVNEEQINRVAPMLLIGQLWVDGEDEPRYWAMLPYDNHWFDGTYPGYTYFTRNRDGSLKTNGEVWYYLEDPHPVYRQKYEDFLAKHQKSDDPLPRMKAVLTDLVKRFPAFFTTGNSAGRKERSSPRKNFWEPVESRKHKTVGKRLNFEIERNSLVKYQEDDVGSSSDDDILITDKKESYEIREFVLKKGDPVGIFMITSFQTDPTGIKVQVHALKFIKPDRVLAGAPPNELWLTECEFLEPEDVIKLKNDINLKVLSAPSTKQAFRQHDYNTSSVDTSVVFVRLKVTHGLESLTEDDLRLLKGDGAATEKSCHLCTAKEKREKSDTPWLKTIGEDLREWRKIDESELVLMLKGDAFRNGDCIYLSPDTVKRRVHAPKRYWMDKKKLKGNLKEFSDPDVYPEFHRWVEKDFAEPEVKPFQVARITGFSKSRKGFVKIDVQLLYRAADCTNFQTYEDVLKNDHTHQVYWADEDTATVKLRSADAFRGRCYVKAVDNRTAGEDWVVGGPHRFFCLEKIKFVEAGAIIGLKLSSAEQDLFNERSVRAPDYLDLGKKLPTLEVFGGAGGLAEGLRSAKVSDTKWSIEHWKPAARTFKENFPGCEVFDTDANVLLHERIEANKEELVVLDSEKKILPEPDEVRMIAGGPPCQGFSGLNHYQSGEKSKENNEQLPLFLSYGDVYRSEVFLLENVEGFMKGSGGKLSEKASASVLSLLEMGYQLTFGVLQSGAFGVPQSRRRFFIIAVAPWIKLPNFPEAQYCFSSNSGRMDKPVMGFSDFVQRAESVSRKGSASSLGSEKGAGCPWSAPYRKLTVWDAISGLPSLEDGQEFKGQWSKLDKPKSFYELQSPLPQVRGFDRQFSGGLADRVSGPRRSEVER